MNFIPLIFVKQPNLPAPKSFLVRSIKQGLPTAQEAEEAAKAWLKELRELVALDAMPGHVTEELAGKGLARGFIRYFPGVEE